MKKLTSVAAVVMLAAGLGLASPQQSQAVLPGHLEAAHVTASRATLPDTATRNLAGTKLNGLRLWRLYLTNATLSVVTSPSIVVDSGLAAADFAWLMPAAAPVPVTAFPTTMPNSVTSLDPCNNINDCQTASKLGDEKGLISNHAVTFTAGFDSTRTVTPAIIPAEGGQQTMTVTVTPRDVRYTSDMTCFDVVFDRNLPGVSRVSHTASDPGTMYPTDNTSINPNVLDQMRLCGLQAATGAFILGQTYTFSTTYDVPNAYGQPFRFIPEMVISGQSAVSLSSVNSDKVTIPDSTLSGGKGPAFRQGSSTFTVGSVSTWEVKQAVAADVSYGGTTHVPTAPQNVQVISTSTGAHVQWEPPATTGTGGQLAGYQVRIYTS